MVKYWSNIGQILVKYWSNIGQDPRGTDSADEFDRQTDKLVTAVLAIEADVLGLVELENAFQAGSSGNAIEYLVAQLNAATAPGTYAWVDPGQPLWVAMRFSVTLNFLAGGGDSYPFPTGASANRVDLYDLNGDGNMGLNQTLTKFIPDVNQKRGWI
ncbi:hypothetical protein [Prochlorothrix hollandica]|uniref:hypothetical protein n=1 Tax=Prochlorothrix hollandica TaxID=1223 RepID=UPI0033423DBC